MMKRKILFFIESFSGGGAEKVLITLLSHLDYSKYDVGVLTISDVGTHKKEFEELRICNPSHLKYKTICGTGEGIWQKSLYKLIYNYLPLWLVCRFFVPDGYNTYVAFIEGFCTKVLSYKEGRKVAWVHIDLQSFPWTIHTGIYRNIEEERRVYDKYEKVVCVSRSVESVMTDYYGLQNTITIYNPIDVEEIRKKADETIIPMESSFNIISIGRLVVQKGYDLLIPIIERLKHQGLNVRLYILGEGSEREHLEQMIVNNCLEEIVYLMGYVENPYPYIKKADLFVCSSRAEGYSLVVAESLTLATPVVSMRCSGPEEVLDEGRYGLLCNSYDEFEEALAMVVEDREKYISLKEKTKTAWNRFDIRKTMEQIEDVL